MERIRLENGRTALNKTGTRFVKYVDALPYMPVVKPKFDEMRVDDSRIKELCNEIFDNHMAHCFSAYKRLRALGVPYKHAAAVLPLCIRKLSHG